MNDRASLLTGRAADAAAYAGHTVCSRFNVGRNTISDSIAKHRLTRAAEIGKHLRAGTNCGSCLPELRNMLV